MTQCIYCDQGLHPDPVPPHFDDVAWICVNEECFLYGH